MSVVGARCDGGPHDGRMYACNGRTHFSVPVLLKPVWDTSETARFATLGTYELVWKWIPSAVPAE